MSDGDFDGSEMQCSYCGKWIYADTPRCPKCGNYTDGLGHFGRPEKEGRPIPRMYLIAAWLAILGMLLPLLLSLYFWLKR